LLWDAPKGLPLLFTGATDDAGVSGTDVDLTNWPVLKADGFSTSFATSLLSSNELRLAGLDFGVDGAEDAAGATFVFVSAGS